VKRTKNTKKKEVVNKLTKSIFDVTLFKSDRWNEEKEFLLECHLQKEELEKAQITWQELALIYLDHERNMISLSSLANTVSQMMQNNPSVNSIRYRVKEPRRLVEKIVKKRLEGRDINSINYKKEITDLVGVRLLHVLKTDWLLIHKSIIDTFKLNNDTSPIAYVAESDKAKYEKLYIDNGCLCKSNPRYYKSVHYDIEIGFTKEKTILEIQVRTMNEEAWGELDHKINYPNPTIGVVGDFIKAASMLSSTADELGQQIIIVNEQINRMNNEQQELKQEKEKALSEVEKLISTLAKTTKQKEQAKKALKDLESVNRDTSVNFNNHMSILYQQNIGDNQIVGTIGKPLSYNIAGELLNCSVNGEPINVLSASTFQNPLKRVSMYNSKCRYCNCEIEGDLLSITNVCNSCSKKGFM